ncbi:putative Ig domain-containing protein [Curtobacterium sp. ISL-83]|uniref:putative Ig domain-containing protein n=1 Tax=Curtobacterium sp. ISL-83 TaxID=2819145 RepID=UPI001BE8C5E6|nr:putative Ig domain-containing protein [Curtobacterium sp. ISL-83]MBT2500930.1 putative Ig domain-containing protein [Curtobacterium sp. ISL-83]
MHRNTSAVRRACAVGTTIALVGLTTGLGVFSASTAYAVDAPSAVSASASPTDAATGVADPAASPSPTASASPDAPVTGAPTPITTAPSKPNAVELAPAVPDPSATPSATTPQPSTPAATPAAAGTVTISGDAKVGVTLHAETTGFVGPHTYSWTRDDATTTVVSTDDFYKVTTDDIGHVLTLTVTDTLAGTSSSDATATVTQDVAFADAATNTVDTPLEITATAGAAYSHDFAVAQGSGTVTYSIGYSYPDEVDPTDPTDQPSNYLPDGVTFDPSTGAFSATSYSAGSYEFTVIASNGTSTATEYVDVTINPGKAVGVMAAATDLSSEELFTSGKSGHFWIIAPDGSITTVSVSSDPNAEPTFTPGGQPTVKQGQSLWIQGNAVDQYGNDTAPVDPETGNDVQPVVTSDVASDQISFDENEFANKVTFPHASTHHLTVAQQDVSVSFAVTVVPTATTIAVVHPVAPTTGELAYTGSDATGALPWALGLLVAGAGLIGARTLRRRRAQR